MTTDLDSVNAALERAIQDLSFHPQSDDFIGTVRSALFLVGRFITAIDKVPSGQGFSPEQMRALSLGAQELWTKGAAAYRGFVLIAERAATGGIRIRAERVS
jgi:hypothetical protein